MCFLDVDAASVVRHLFFPWYGNSWGLLLLALLKKNATLNKSKGCHGYSNDGPIFINSTPRSHIVLKFSDIQYILIGLTDNADV